MSKDERLNTSSEIQRTFPRVKEDGIKNAGPTIFSENGKKLLSAFEDEEISRIAWEKYGFRTGVAGTNISTTDLGIGIPSKITSTVTSLKMSYYNKLIDYLSK